MHNNDDRRTLKATMANRQTLCERFVLERRLPLNYDVADSRYFEREMRRECSGVFLRSAEDVVLDVPKGVARKGWRVLEESLATPALVPSYATSYVLRSLWKSRERISKVPCLLLYNSYCDGYGHWMSDAIPRAHVVKDLLRDYVIVLPARYRAPYYLESLAPFGVVPEQIRYVQSALCRIERLDVVSHVGPSFCNVKDEVLQGVRDLFYRHYGFRPTRKRRIYVSRAKVARRFVENESEVVELLSRYGFEIIHFQDCTFAEQLQIAAETEMMVGLTGSGLNNMMFMPPGSKVLEFKMKGDYQNLHYFGFASGLQLDYFYQICDTSGGARFEANFVVDLGVLERIIRRMTRG